MSGSWLPLLTEVIRLCIWLIALVLIFAPLEYLFAVHENRFFRAGFLTDLFYYFLNNLLPTILLGIPLGVLAWAVHRLIPSGFLQMAAGFPVWLRIAIGFVAGEVGYYWGHRLSHEIPILWRFHAIHHSDEAMDFLVNSRAHPLDVAWGRFFMLIPVYLLGLGGPAVPGGLTILIAVVLIGTLWSFFVHANIRWRFGLMEWLVSTPHFHHWHHTKTGPINRNYASNLPLIDWIFGSFLLPREWPQVYGIDGPMPPALVDQLIHPFIPAESRGFDNKTQPRLTDPRMAESSLERRDNSVSAESSQGHSVGAVNRD